MKRGIKIGSERLPTHLEYYLRSLSSDIFREETLAFIKKQNEIVLIQPIPSLLHHNIGLWYTGFVDLSAGNSRLDYRTPISGILWLVLLVSMFVFRLLSGSPNEMISAICVLVVLIPILVIAHGMSKRTVLKYVENNLQRSGG
jgi:hypothetical protein